MSDVVIKQSKTAPFHWIHSRNEKLFKCDQCSITFNFQQDMINHFIHNHDHKVYYACSFCLKNFDSSNALLDHFESQHISLQYSCSKCGNQEFTSLADLLTHSLSHRNCKQSSASSHMANIAIEKRCLTCNHCSKLFSLPSLLRSHMTMHLGSYNCHKGHKVNANKICSIDHFINFSCSECKNSKNDEIVEEHSMSSTLRQAIDCISNNDTEITYNEIDKVRDENASNTIVICGECNTRFKNMKSLTRHLKNEHDVEVQIIDDEDKDGENEEEIINKNFSSRYSCSFLCIFCLKRFANKHMLECHEKAHTEEIDPENKLRMSCDYCQNIFSGQVNYIKHISSCCKNPENSYKIKSTTMKLLEHPVDTIKCKKEIKIKLQIKASNNHKEDEIDWNESELAEIGDKDLINVNKALTELESQNMMKKHQKMSTKSSLNSNVDSDFDDRVSLNIKRKSTLFKGKGEGKVYVCHYCEKSFRSKQKFLDHYFNHDNSVKPYGCPACDARLGYSTSVPKHVQMHLRDLGTVTIERKPHLCPKCGKDYRDRASLKRHEAMVHLKIGHLCLECDRKFSSPHALKQHLHQHTGDFIYECDQCDKRYGNASSLHNHKRSHSQIKFICNICAKSFSLKHHLLRHITTHTGFGTKSVKKLKKELPETSL